MRLELSLLGLLLALFALALWLWARRSRWRSGLPPGKLVYSDTGIQHQLEQPLYSRRYQLTGRPDYLMEESGHIIPVEVKSSLSPESPYLSRQLQLAAYCPLVEDIYGQAPHYGVLRYRDRTRIINYTPEQREILLTIVRSMRQDYGSRRVSRSHENPARCRACGFHSRCRETLE